MTDKYQDNKRIARNTLFMGIRMVIVLIISLYTTRAVLKALGVIDYGVYNVVCGFVSMFAFLNTSMSNGIQRFFNFEYGKNGEQGANKVYISALIIQGLLCLIVFVLSETFGLWYLHNKMIIPSERMVASEWIFQFSIMNFLLIIMQVPYTAAVMAHEKMDFYAFVSILDVVLKLALVLALPFFPIDLLLVYGSFLTIISGVNFVLYYTYCKRKFSEIKINRDCMPTKNMFKSMLGFSGWNVFGSFSNMMRDQGVNLILNLFFGPVVNAARGVAVQVNSAVMGLVKSMLTPVRPQVVQSYARGDMERVMNLTYTISKFSVFFLLLLSVPLIVEIDFVLKLWLGNNVPPHTSSFVAIILATNLILVPMSAQAALVHASGNMRNYQVIGSIVKFLSVPIAFFLLKFGMEPEWAFIMVLLFDAIGLVVGMIIIKGIMPFNITEYVVKVFIPILVVIVPVVGLSLCVHQLVKNEIVRFVLVCLSSTCAFALFVYFLGMTRPERNLAVKMIKEKIQNKKIVK